MQATVTVRTATKSQSIEVNHDNLDSFPQWLVDDYFYADDVHNQILRLGEIDSDDIEEITITIKK